MCGILFHLDPSGVSEDPRFERALAHLRVRGPDRQDLYYGPDFAVGHTRLSIVDLSDAAAQPFWDAGRRHVLTYNGEIYNYREIRRGLSAAGVALRTESDTEVLLESVLHFGLEETLGRVRGMFAFVLHDTETGRTVAVRDHFGQKPLHYHEENGRLSIASDVQSLIELSDAAAQPDMATYSVYLSARGEHGTRGLFHVNRTFFANFHTLPAGHMLVRDANGVEIKPYFEAWDLYDPEHAASLGAKSENDLIADLRSLFAQAVERHLVSDVDVGVLLSGGMDSTLVFWMAQALQPNLSTFTKVSPGIEEIPQTVVPMILEQRPARNFFCTQRPEDYLGGLLRFVRASRAPSRWGGGPPMSTLCAEARRNGVHVVLGGDCVDEYFCGYGHYEGVFADAAPDPARLGDLVGIDRASPFFDAASGDAYEERETRTRAAILERLSNIRDARETFVQAMLLHDTSTFLQACNLPHSDAYSMMTSVELRNPMLDIDLVRFAINLPAEYKVRTHPGGHFGKYLLRELVERDIGPFMNLPKEGTRNYAMAVAEPRFWRRDKFAIGEFFDIPEDASKRAMVRLINLEVFHRTFFLKKDDFLGEIMTAEGMETYGSKVVEGRATDNP